LRVILMTIGKEDAKWELQQEPLKQWEQLMLNAGLSWMNSCLLPARHGFAS